MGVRFWKKQCVELSPQAEEARRGISVTARVRIAEACRSLCDGTSASASTSGAEEDLWGHVVDSYVIRYRRSRPSDYSPQCGRSLTFWVERIEPVQPA